MVGELSGLAGISGMLGISAGLLAVVLIWSLIWKAIALWKSARKNHLVWFIILLVVNTLGILEILYIFLFSKIRLEKINKKEHKRKRK